MKCGYRVSLDLWLLILVLAGPALCASLKAGVAKVDITPSSGLTLWGFEDRTAPSTGTRDPLYARVLVLEAGETRMALVTLDLGRAFGPDSMDRLRAEVRQSTGISNVLVVVSHTHSAPVVSDSYPNGTPPWESATLKKIAQAIEEAQRQAIDAQLGTGYGVTYIGHNRLRHNPDGTVSWFERNTTRIPTAPVDPTVSVLRVDTAGGRPLAIWSTTPAIRLSSGPTTWNTRPTSPV